MLDPVLLRQQPADLAARLKAARGFDLDAAALERLEAERKQIQTRTQELQNLRNTRSKAIGQAKAKGEDVSALMAEVAGIGDELRPARRGWRRSAPSSTRSRSPSPTCRTTRCRMGGTKTTTSSSTAGARRARSISR